MKKDPKPQELLLILFFTLFIALITAILLTGCNPATETSSKPAVQTTNRLELDSTSQYYNKRYTVFTLEGCEYIVVGYGNHQWGSHKGNCKNPIHYENKGYEQ
jgi:hypothetical protein